MKMKFRGIIFLSLIFTALLQPVSLAKYETGSNTTGVKIFDYIENMRRNMRENMITDEQAELVEDSALFRSTMGDKVKPDSDRPVTIEGDDLFYDERTGDVMARGDVRITDMDARRFISDEARGNLKKQEIFVDGEGRVLQMTPGCPRVSLSGYRTVYNYSSGIGRMEDVSGKADHFYVKGRRIEIYPERILIYDGSETKCGAKSPDYKISGDFIEIYPNSEMIIYHAKFWIKDKIIHSRDEYRVDLTDTERDQVMPTFGYDSDNGAWVAYPLIYSLAPRTEAYFKFRYYNRKHARNVYGAKWENGGNKVRIEAGKYSDSDDRWMKKEPNFIYEYSNRVGEWPFSYTLTFNEGWWKRRGIHSMHTYYAAYFSRDVVRPIPSVLPGMRFVAGLGYDVTHESANHNRVKGIRYDATLLQDIGSDVVAFVGYHYRKATTKNSLYDFDLDDYSKKLQFGASWEITDRDRLMFGEEFDAEKHSQEDVYYYWFHDMHCAQMILRYKVKDKKWKIRFQFTPW